MSDNQQQQPPICKRENCGQPMVWTAQYGWYCDNPACRQQQFEEMLRQISNKQIHHDLPVKPPQWGGDE